MTIKLDLAGQKYGRLTVISEHGRSKNKNVLWLCKCDCGNTTVIPATIIRRGITISCGCFRDEMSSKRRKTHGYSYKDEYLIWQGMKKRCLNKNCKAYPMYGGRGISICERWNKFENFLADMGPRPSKDHSIDRKENDGNYEPTNCRWTIPTVQARNTRSRKDGGVPIKGVCWHKGTGKYTAQIAVNGKNIYLGVFASIEEAAHARKLAEEKYWREESCTK